MSFTKCWSFCSCFRVLTTWPHALHVVAQYLVKIGYGNDLPGPTKPLTDPMLTYHQWIVQYISNQNILQNWTLKNYRHVSQETKS